MNATRRRRRTFQPEVDSLEGRVVLSAVAAVDAAHAHAVQVHEQRELKHELKAELHKEKHAPGNDGKIKGGSVSASGAMSISVGGPKQAMLTASAGATSRTALQIAALAPNNLDAANIALQGMSVGVESVGTVSSHGRPGRGPTTTTTTGTTTSTGTGSTVTSTAGASTTTTTTTLSTPGSIGTVTISLPTTTSSSTTSTTSSTATTSTFGSTNSNSTTTGGSGTVPIFSIPTASGSSATNTTGGTTPGSGGVTFTNATLL